MTLYKELNKKLAINIDKVFDLLELDVVKRDHYYVGHCPVHGGDNRSAFNIFPTGESFPGYWVCYTHHCEEGRPGLVNLIKTLKGWTTRDVADWANTQSFPAQIKVAVPKEQKQLNLSRQKVRNSLDIPSIYFLSKGFNEELLNKYDIGTCRNPNKEMYNRAVFPIYYLGECVGCIGRTIKPVTKFNPKWKPNKGFKIHQYLYNYDNIQSDTVVVVESCGNVLKLVQNSITNCVGLFGSTIYKKQIIDLKLKSVKRLILCLDNDKAGQDGIDRIRKKVDFELETVSFDGYNDIAEMPDQKVKELFNDYNVFWKKTIG